jgi:hypothetical protein
MPAPRKEQRFLVHAEWREPVRGKLFWRAGPLQERTVEIAGNVMSVMREAQRRFPGARLMMRSIPEKDPPPAPGSLEDVVRRVVAAGGQA